MQGIIIKLLMMIPCTCRKICLLWIVAFSEKGILSCIRIKMTRSNMNVLTLFLTEDVMCGSLLELLPCLSPPTLDYNLEL